MSAIWVCPLSSVEDRVRALEPGHLVSLLDPGSMIATPPGLAQGRHLQLECHDISDDHPEFAAPGEPHARALVDLAGAWDEAAPILVHCWAGVSRSTASAFVIACARNPEGDEFALARRLRDASPTAWPNARLVEAADRVLGRGGRMSEAVAAIGDGDLGALPEAFELRWR